MATIILRPECLLSNNRVSGPKRAFSSDRAFVTYLLSELVMNQLITAFKLLINLLWRAWVDPKGVSEVTEHIEAGKLVYNKEATAFCVTQDYVRSSPLLSLWGCVGHMTQGYSIMILGISLKKSRFQANQRGGDFNRISTVSTVTRVLPYPCVAF